jgi:EmrB/QacA subfamily drug resistance transporter
VTRSLKEIQADGLPSEPQATEASPETGSRQRSVMLLVAGGAFLATLDLFIVNIAFSKIRGDFPGTTPAHLSWVLNAYGIVFAALLVPAGRLADLYGRRTLFRLGMIIFALASAGCAASPTIDVLIACRAVQAGGAALMVPTSLGLLLAAYPKSMHRRIVSSWSAIGTTAAACGPPIGGVLVDINWRLIFLVNLPIALPAILFGRLLPSEEHESEGGLPDFVGAAMLALGIAGLVAGLSNASAWGASDVKLWACIAVGLLGIAAFLYRCGHHPRPVFDLALLKVRQFRAANMGLILFNAGFAGILLGGPLFLQQVWGYSSALAGIAYAPGPVVATICALLSGRLPITRRVSAIIGCLSFGAASTWWALMLGTHPHYLTHFLLGSILTGVGVGFSMAAVMGVGASSLPPARYATGTGVLNTSRQIGSAIGVAVIVAIVGVGVTPSVFHHAYLFTAACGVLAALSATQLGEPRT